MAQITQAMILAAGKGTRLRPLTLSTPKPLVPVGKQPLIVWHINALKQAGIEDIVINTSWLSDKLMQALGDGTQFGVRLHWSVEEQPLETAGGIAQALESGQLSDEPFLLINGDVWTQYDLKRLSQQQLGDKLAHLVLVDNPEHNRKGDFGLCDGMAVLVDTPSNPQQPPHTHTFAGISVLSPKLVAQVPAGEVMPLAPLLKHAISQGQVSAERTQAMWIDVGTPERLQAVNDYVNGYVNNCVNVNGQ